jgi:hypothetical protein
MLQALTPDSVDEEEEERARAEKKKEKAKKAVWSR